MSVNLRINTENTNINMKSVDPKLKITGQGGEFEVKNNKGKFNVKQKSDKLEIRTYNAYKQLALESPQDLVKSQGKKSKQKSDKNISSYVRDGEAMMKIEKKGTPILQIAEKNAFKEDNVNLNVTYFPKEPIEIKVDKGYLKVEAEPDKIEVKANNKLKIEVLPGGVYTTVDKYPKVTVEAVGEIYDTKI